jgi:hypothetical protein
MTVITMSRKEIDRMSVLHDLADGRIKIAGASTLMGLGRRQVFRLAKAYGAHGPQALVSRRRGRPSNPAIRRLCVPKRWASAGSATPTLPDAGGGEACRAARDSSCARDTAAMDDEGWSVEGSPGTVEACASAAVSPRLRGRTDPDRWIGALVVRRAAGRNAPCSFTLTMSPAG